MRNPGKGSPVGEIDDEEPEVRALVEEDMGPSGPCTVLPPAQRALWKHMVERKCHEEGKLTGLDC